MNKRMPKVVANALRHDPDSLNLVLDDLGWTSLDDLYSGLISYTEFDISYSDFVSCLQSNNRGRFEITSNSIRAIKGHTTEQVSYKVSEPPQELMYRVYPRSYRESLDHLGIQSKHKYVELFTDGIRAGQDSKKRRIKPNRGLLVTVQAHTAYHDGTVFYFHENSWYVKEIDPYHLALTEV